MSLFNNKLQKIQMAMLDTDVQDKFNNLSKGVSEYEWTATAGQLTYVLPAGQTYDTTTKWLAVFVGGAPIPDSQIQKDSSTQFTLLIDSSKIQAGMIVFARWTQPYIPATSGHKSTHYLGGTDEIDITNLKNFNEQVATPLAQNAQQLADIVVTARNVGLVAGDSSKATQNATTLNNYLATAQNTEITFLGADYYFDNTITLTGTNKLTGKKSTRFILTSTSVDFIYLKPFASFENIGLKLPTNHTKAGISLHDADYTQWTSNHLHYVRNVFIYGDATSLSSTGISLDAANGYNVSNFSCYNVTMMNCSKGVSITASGTGWASGNFFDNVYPQNCNTGLYLAQTGTGQVGGNRFIHEYQFSSTVNGQTAVYCNGFENSFIGKIWDAKPGQLLVKFDNGSKSNYIAGTGFTPNIKNSYVIDYGQDNVFAGALDNTPQIRGAYKYDSSNNWQSYNWQKFYGSYSDVLFNSDKANTVNLTLGSSSIVSGSLNTLFAVNGGMILANATSGSPIVIEIILTSPVNNVPEFGITFQYGYTPQNVMIEYASSSGGTYSTGINTTTNRLPSISFGTSAGGSTIGKIRFTLSNAIINATTNPNGYIGISNIYMFSTVQMGNYYLPASGGKMYGIINMNGNYIQVGSKASLPTASSTYQGMMAYVAGNGTTTADTLYICLMSSTGTYSWKQITAG